MLRKDCLSESAAEVNDHAQQAYGQPLCALFANLHCVYLQAPRTIYVVCGLRFKCSQNLSMAWHKHKRPHACMISSDCIVDALQCWLKITVETMASSSAALKHSKLLRSISGCAGVSDRGLSQILQWVKAHPDVLNGNLQRRTVLATCCIESAD